MAAELVLKQHAAGEHYPERVLLPGTLIVRDSTGAPEWLRAPIPLSRRPRARQAPRARPRRRTA
jgi:hypothetical protein